MTGWSLCFFWSRLVSIHTPTKGVTYLCQNSLRLGIMFQSTHPRRVWLIVQSVSSNFRIVSIHTPTKGVTCIVSASKADGKFQSTHPRRVWQEFFEVLFLRPCFNPHTHEGCDPQLDYAHIGIDSFNPHTHEGCDLPRVFFWHCPKVSIHTPTKGVTKYAKAHYSHQQFQSTHPRRVWHFICHILTRG